MRFAEKNGNRIIPNPLEKDAICPLCKSSVIGKCGKINVWHWAHKNNEDCDNWGGIETKWHLDWKGEFPEETQEVIIGKHRADVKIKDVIVEFQNSSISSEEIIEREKFYGKMIWVLSENFTDNFCFKLKNGFVTFRWKWPRRIWEDSIMPKYMDLGITKFGDNILQHKLLLIKKINWGGYVGGWGKIISKEDFLRRMKDGYYGY